MLIQDQVFNLLEGETGIFLSEPATFRRVRFVGGFRGLQVRHDSVVNDLVLEDVEFIGQSDCGLWAGANEARAGWVLDNVRARECGAEGVKLHAGTQAGGYLSPTIHRLHAVRCGLEKSAAITLSNITRAHINDITVIDAGPAALSANSGRHVNGLWFGNLLDSLVENITVNGVTTGDGDGVGLFLDKDHYRRGSCRNIVRHVTLSNCKNNTLREPFGDPDIVKQWTMFNSSGLGICCDSNDNDCYAMTLHDNFIGVSIGVKTHGNTVAWLRNDAVMPLMETAIIRGAQ